MTRKTLIRRIHTSLALAWLGSCMLAGNLFGQAAGSAGFGSARITIDPETRQLIIVADEETHANLQQVIQRLDRPTPQVLIKVVFLEVTYRKGLDLGIEGSYRTQSGSTTGVVSQAFGLAAQGASPTTPIFTGTGAGMYQVLSSDFQATLRAIAEAGKTEILSRPSILTRNNQEAVIMVGQQVPLITSVRYDAFGNQINAVSYQDVGIILRVVPTITSDGLVEMIVSPIISALDEQTVTISAGVSAPVINQRSADTVVVTPDGQTVVIGGLMQNNKTSTERKIPLLGDIPVLGNLFKRRINSDAKTELLIFLTPHIVKEPAHLAGVTAVERAAQEMVPKSFTDEQLNRFLESMPYEGDDFSP